jgi:hypothetical protein
MRFVDEIRAWNHVLVSKLKEPIMSLASTISRVSVFVGFTALAIGCGSKSSSPAPATAPLAAPLKQTDGDAVGQDKAPAPVGPGMPFQQQPLPPVGFNQSSTTVAVEKTIVATEKVAAGGPVVAGGAVGAPVEGRPATPPPVVPQTFSVGKYYAFTLPATMHMQEYATNWNTQGAQQFYMVRNDPTYIGNYFCAGPFDLAAIIPNAISEKFQYCYTTPPTNFVQPVEWVKSNHQGLNHLLTATNPSHPFTSIEINLFDDVLPYEHDGKKGMSKFDFLCGGQLVQATPVIPIMPNFWGGVVHTIMLSCQAPVVIGGLTQAGSSWVNAYVTTFYVSAAALPNIACFNTGWGVSECDALNTPYRNSSLLEVTVIQQITGLTQQQANQQAQAIFAQGLRQTMPLIAK